MLTAIRSVRCYLLVALLLVAPAAMAQGWGEDKPQKFTDRFFYGGSLGLAFGTFTYIDIVPMAGIWVLPQWSLGVTTRYSFLSQRNLFYARDNRFYRSHIFGYSGFTQIIPIRDLSLVTPLKIRGGFFLHGEYERLFLDQRLTAPLGGIDSGKTWLDVFLIGVGYRQKIGRRSAVNLLFLWDLSNSGYSPYVSSPIFRMNIAF